VPAKQTGKKHGKGMVNLGDGFVRIDTRTVGFINCKDVGAVTENGAVLGGAAIVERLKRPQEGLNDPLDCYVMRLRLISIPNRRICSSGRR
jgi:hypothetical protein